MLLLTMLLPSLCWSAFDAAGQHMISLNPDLSFLFDCTGGSYPPADDAIEHLLQDQGFRVLNKVRLAAKHRVEFPYALYIVGIDSQRRMVVFMSLPFPRGTYSLVLNSPPPTQHATSLEDSLLTFVSRDLGCKIRQTRRDENGPDARDFYDKTFKIREGWFRQADEMERPPA